MLHEDHRVQYGIKCKAQTKIMVPSLLVKVFILLLFSCRLTAVEKTTGFFARLRRFTISRNQTVRREKRIYVLTLVL